MGAGEVGLIEGAVIAADFHESRGLGLLVAGDDDITAVFFGRVALREPSWPLRAAHELGIDKREAPYPPQYQRGSWH